MTASPALAAAIRAGCEIGTWCDYPACGGSCPSRVAVTCALRSLATPTPEAIEAMARAMFAQAHEPEAARMTGTKMGWAQIGRQFQDYWRIAATHAHAAYWTSILGEKPAEPGAVPITQGVEP